MAIRRTLACWRGDVLVVTVTMENANLAQD
jgi:hypothetical protein